ncbi:hypothetical protein ACJDU8_08830 [Clostridium sp. WILCCON 0269]|uniref:Uncharacterized protein n=1 Tax=Candidatus Clostridium eludens TaxID=3381663 RepID=A0ABW8SI10_9CLOT
MDTSSSSDNINKENAENLYEFEQPIYCPYYRPINYEYVDAIDTDSDDEYFDDNDFDDFDLGYRHGSGRRRRRRRHRRRRHRPLSCHHKSSRYRPCPFYSRPFELYYGCCDDWY